MFSHFWLDQRKDTINITETELHTKYIIMIKHKKVIELTPR